MSHFPFQRLQGDLANLISNSPPGTRLPSEPDLAQQLGVSRATLREAMRTFETQGLIRRRQGAGTFIVGRFPVMESGLEVLESVNTIAQRLNLPVTTAVPIISDLPADELHARELGIPLGAMVTRVSRVMRVESRPVAYLVDTLPEGVLSAYDAFLAQFNGSVLDFLLRRGDPLSISRTDVSAMGAPADVGKMLEVQRGDVLLQFTACLYSVSGKVVDYSLSYFLPGYFRFHVVRRVGNSA
jgi:GntR family transcriptional regulator